MNLVYLIRFGEIALKSNPVRKRALKQLVSNIQRALAKSDVSAKVWATWDRVYVDGENLENILSKIFGIVSFSRIVQFNFKNKKELLDWGENLFKEKVRGKRYGVRVRRSGQHSFSSKELEKELGSRLWKYGNGVDLTNPEIWIRLEVKGNTASAIYETYPGPGGIPTGTNGRAIALFSGGIDSPVAAWLAMKRGVRVDFAYIDLGDVQLVYDVFDSFAKDWCTYTPKFFLIRVDKILNRLIRLESKYRQVLLKIIMYRAVEKLNYPALITGEALGQASSQTLQNLSVINSFAETLVIRPLIGLDKQETIEIAKKIGTYELSIRVPELCNLATGRVVTATKKHIIQEQLSLLGKMEFEISRIKSKSDLRITSAVEQGEKMFDKIIHVNEENFDDWFARLYEMDNSKSYLFICKTGLMARILATELEKRGIRAKGIAEHQLESLTSKNP